MCRTRDFLTSKGGNRMSFRNPIRFLSAGALVLSLAACASAPKVTRTEVDETIDLSGNWNDTDSRLVSEEMVRDALGRPWVDEFMSAKHTKPRLIVGEVLN